LLPYKTENFPYYWSFPFLTSVGHFSDYLPIVARHEQTGQIGRMKNARHKREDA
jgi:hypothetical protein